jgi:predicted RecA/RadA family phage recombinase
MTATFIHRGDAIDHIPLTDLPAGSVVAQGDLVAIAVQPIPAGHLGAIQVTGVFDFPCSVWGHIPIGTKVYWATYEKTVSFNGSDGPYIGKTVRDYNEGNGAIRVRLSQ